MRKSFKDLHFWKRPCASLALSILPPLRPYICNISCDCELDTRVTSQWSTAWTTRCYGYSCKRFCSKRVNWGGKTHPTYGHHFLAGPWAVQEESELSTNVYALLSLLLAMGVIQLLQVPTTWLLHTRKRELNQTISPPASFSFCWSISSQQ